MHSAQIVAEKETETESEAETETEMQGQIHGTVRQFLQQEA